MIIVYLLLGLGLLSLFFVLGMSFGVVLNNNSWRERVENGEIKLKQHVDIKDLEDYNRGI